RRRFHSCEVTKSLVSDREAPYGRRLDLPAGTAVRVEPGEIKTVRLVALGGSRQVYGGSGFVMGSLDDADVRKKTVKKLRKAGFGDSKRDEETPKKRKN